MLEKLDVAAKSRNVFGSVKRTDVVASETPFAVLVHHDVTAGKSIFATCTK